MVVCLCFCGADNRRKLHAGILCTDFCGKGKRARLQSFPLSGSFRKLILLLRILLLGTAGCQIGIVTHDHTIFRHQIVSLEDIIGKDDNTERFVCKDNAAGIDIGVIASVRLVLFDEAVFLRDRISALILMEIGSPEYRENGSALPEESGAYG